ncbi:carbohydrate-binding protein [Confluentibacter citreus]|uniref:hypothetical protein n=1 Tax=Confluentibacter citreus TaxID=2007307 RepID=UPI00195D0344|nr:hypothetical protein [Confluentibacter citreus]
MKKINNISLSIILVSLCFILFSCHKNAALKNHKSIYADEVYKKGMQTIPGKLECEYYNFGGEGIAYHDNDTKNSGSGNLNRGTDYLSTFRINEAVDISFTKYHDSIDNSKYNIVQPEKDQLYVGWTQAGEWTKYTIDVKISGVYQIGLMYTSNQNGKISVVSNKTGNSGILNVPTTFHKDDPIAWRQWHHWNYIHDLGTIPLKKGIQTITLLTVAVGQMNYDYLEFKLLK